MFVFPSGKSTYQIEHSLRFRASNSAYLSRTFGSAGGTTWTYSAWVKRGALTAAWQDLMTCTSGANESGFGFNTIYGIGIFSNGAAATNSTALFRDPSAWYHVVVKSNGTTVIGYVNNQQVVSYSGSLNAFNTAVNHVIGKHANSASEYLDGLLSEIYFIDGQALTPSSFGETNSDGVWVPKKYSGTYGTNGFYLKFNDGIAVANLGRDYSGNSNTWSPTNISLTAGVTYDWMTDTPTNNYCTMLPLSPSTGVNVSLSEGNLKATGVGGTSGSARASYFLTEGKWYWEVTQIAEFAASSNLYPFIGSFTGADAFDVRLATETAALTPGWDGWNYESDGTINLSGTGTVVASPLTNLANNDVLGIALDIDGGTVKFYLNGSALNSGNAVITGLAGLAHNPMVGLVSTASVAFNFGQRPFAYTPPTGFKALCTANLPAVTITNPRKHFDVNAYVGNGSTSRSFSSFQFQPDFIWSKNRTTAYHHRLVDSLRGVRKTLYSSQTTAETDEWATYGEVNSFDSSGYTITTGGTAGNFLENINSELQVAWLWKAGGAGVSNTDGSITSTVSANTTAGFSIVTYTGTGVNATVGHGLGKAPSLVIVKKRNAGSSDWRCYHVGLDASAPNNYFIDLNATTARTNAVAAWNNSGPSSSTFSLGTNVNTNGSTDTFVAYCFAEIPGFSKFGSYTSNGSADGPFAYCGFRPRWVLIKNIDAAGSSWHILDSMRDTYNVESANLLANLPNAEASVAFIDATANGFKVRQTGTDYNTGTNVFIYAAFAEHPFGGSNVAPSPAR